MKKNYSKKDIPYIENIIQNFEKELEKDYSKSTKERIKDFIWDWERILFDLKNQK